MIIDQTTKRKYINKRTNAKKENIAFKLSLEDYVQLLDQAGIAVDDVAPAGYHLARYSDSGPYEVGNCRFIPHLENVAEKKVSETWRNSSRVNAVKMIAANAAQPREVISERSRKGGLVGGGWNRLEANEIDRRIEILKSIDTTKYGWVQEAAFALGLTHTQTKRFVDEHFAVEIYRRSPRKSFNLNSEIGSLA